LCVEDRTVARPANDKREVVMNGAREADSSGQSLP